MSSVLAGRYSSRTVVCKHCGASFFSESGRAQVCEGCRRSFGRRRMKAWIERNPDVHRARSRASFKPRENAKHNASASVYRAIKAGVLARQPCEVCGAIQVDAHHEDYSKPLSVRWLCRKHHAVVHRKDRADVFGE